MSESFSVGEIVEIHSLVRSPEWNGCEATIIGPCELRRFKHVVDGKEGEMIGHRLESSWWPRPFILRPANLRKRRPPQDWVKLCNLTDLPTRLQHEVNV